MSHQERHEGHTEHEDITIETLATPPPQIPPAPLSRRIIAGVADSGIIATGWIALIIGERGFLGFWTVAESMAVTARSVGYLATIAFAYYFALEGVFASTVGKSLLRLRVVGSDGEPCSFRASFKRNLLRFVDWLPALYLVAGFSILTSSHRQRVGDRVASTIVTKVPEKDINPPPAPFLFH
jgi:uncharacterized RDD family membrane protein YckC